MTRASRDSRILEILVTEERPVEYVDGREVV
jgi:hypothetical protein